METKKIKRVAKKVKIDFLRVGEYMKNQQNLIKIFDPQKANKLADMGFKYILDGVNGKSVYAFFVSKELIQYIHSHFETEDFFYDNMLRF